MFHSLPNSALADGNLAELARQLGMMVEHPNQRQPNQGLRPDGTPCIYQYVIRVYRSLYVIDQDLIASDAPISRQNLRQSPFPPLMLHGLSENTPWIPSLFPRVMYHFPSPTVSNEDRESRGKMLFYRSKLRVDLSLPRNVFYSTTNDATEVSTEHRKCFFPRIPH